MVAAVLFQLAATPPRPRLKRDRARWRAQLTSTSRPALPLTASRRMLPAALEAMHTAYTTANAAIHHGTCAHALGRAATQIHDEARQSVADLINASDSSEIIFAPSENRAVELLARSICRNLKRGDNVVIAATESDSMRQIWAAMASRYDLTIHVVRLDDSGQVPFEELVCLLSSNTRLVVLPAACPLLGVFVPLEEPVGFIKAAGIPVLLNATHAIPYEALDVRRLEPDFVVADGATIGAPNTAFLYGRKEKFSQLPPSFGGDEVLNTVDMDLDFGRANWSDIPERLSVGMPSIACAAALGAAANILAKAYSPGLSRHSTELAMRLCSGLESCPSISLFGSEGEKRIPIACFVVDGVEPADVSQKLWKSGVDVECGSHGSQMAHMQQLDCTSSLRVFFDAHFHKPKDVDNFVRLLARSI